MADKTPITDEEIQKWCDKIVAPKSIVLNDKVREIAEYYIEKGKQMERDKSLVELKRILAQLDSLEKSIIALKGSK